MILYTITDFLLDERKEIEKLEKLHKKTRSPERQAEIKEQIQHIYSKGLHACNGYKREIPDCVKEYFLGNREEPTLDEMIKGFKGRKPLNYKLIQAIVMTIIVIATILAIAF